MPLLDIEEECDCKLDPIKCPLVKSWTKKEWLEQFQSSTSAVPGRSSKKSGHGSKRMAQGINVSCTYLQDENGVPVSILKDSPQNQLDKLSLDVLKWLVHTLHKEYLKLRLCADNWKTMRLMMDNYSQWYSYHVKNKGKYVKVESEDMYLEDESISDSEVTLTTHKRSLSELDNLDEHITKQLHMDSNITPKIMRDPSPDRQIITDKGKQKEVVVLEVKNPLSNLVIKPRPRPIPLKIPVTCTNPSTSASAPNPTIIPPSNNTIPASSTPEVQLSADAASLAVKVELVAANCTAEQMGTTTMIDSKRDIVKKRQPSTKPIELANVFATYWNGLSNADKEVYKRKAAAQLILSGQTQGNADNHND
ncbi:hypothetical protein F4604DRAFT_1913810 [Suillus subluteus]|nr:hypothetical protein F4604DRAFT_1913810 [Suillus subluteus]